MAGHQATVHKDDGCNTNVISREFVKKDKLEMNIQKVTSVISQSNKSNIEIFYQTVIDAEVELIPYRYRSN